MAKWIWLKGEQRADSHAEFFIPLSFSGEKTEIRISADSDYTLYVNGKFVSCNQYRDFPYYKIYDAIDITEYLVNGENVIAAEVWFYGCPNFSYYTSNAGLWYEIYQNDRLVKQSDENTLSRLSLAYQSGMEKKITTQIGWSYHYDTTKEDDWKTKLCEGFEKSALGGEGISEPIPRPIERLSILPAVNAKFIRTQNNRMLYDLGREEVGFPTFRIKSPVKQKLRLVWGEHIEDGQVRDIIGPRDFSVEVTVGEGVTEFSSYFRRFGARYLELEYKTPIEVDYLTVFPCEYPVRMLPYDFKNDLRNRIYEIAARTLVLCMHDHYEDCPWREQAMYAMDTRNQIMCGYYAFGEEKFPRAALRLFGEDDHIDGLLNITTPFKGDTTPPSRAIPSFSLHFVTMVYEYYLRTGDLSLLREVFPKLTQIMNACLSNMQNGLLQRFEPSERIWNFYEWTFDLNGGAAVPITSPYETALNCLLSIALGRMQAICDWLGEKADFLSVKQALNQKIVEVFYNKEKGLFINRAGAENYSELVNALCILCGAAEGETAERIASLLASDHDITKCSLSMMCFKYDALLQVDKEKYRSYILTDIDATYSKMLNAGATSFWETENGQSDFGNAASLCHGWSAMPVYYYHVLQADQP